MGTTTTKSHMLLSLNCTREEACTFAVLSFVTVNSSYSALFLQEPWLTAHKEPPALRSFDMFTPSPTHPRIVTYIRKSANFHPSVALNEAGSFLGIHITPSPNTPPAMIYNFYSPGRQQAVCRFFRNFRPNNNAIICGDFNSHHQTWYRHRAAQHHLHLHNDAILVDELVKRLVNLSLLVPNGGTPCRGTLADLASLGLASTLKSA